MSLSLSEKSLKLVVFKCGTDYNKVSHGSVFTILKSIVHSIFPDETIN